MDGVYSLNKVLKKEKKQKENNTTNAYANQLYGNNSSPEAVSSSPSAAQSDYGAYLSAQNTTLKEKMTASGNATGANPAEVSSPTATSAANPAEVSSPTATSAANPVQTSLNNPNNYTLSPYDSKLGIDDQQGIINSKGVWEDADRRGDKMGAWNAYIDAQVIRAKNGYIDDIGDGSGYREFTLSAADNDLPEEARDAVIRLRVMAILDPDNVRYYNAKANEIRSSVAGYISTDGMDYIRNSSYGRDALLNAQYNDNSEFVNPYAEQIESLIKDLSERQAWDASNYNPSTDPAYQAYEQYYTRNANAASQKALANAAAVSGGIAGSYAQQMSAAAAQSYMKQLTDVIPTLQQNAREAYENDIADKLSFLGSLNTMQGTAYDQFNTDRNFRMNQWLQNWQNAWNQYQIEQEIASREDEQAWQEAQNQLDRDLEKYLATL